MASAIPVEVLDDDDDFDWEAAVKEIDLACGEATKLSSSGVNSSNATTYRNSSSHTGSCPKIENNKPSSSRQSTLDRFIGLTGSKSANQDIRHDAREKVEYNDERVSDVSIDPEAAKTWIYPENISVRDYQASMTRTALFSNTLVSLPTGLGKTLIAAVVMYNYFRWFPQGKIVFAAPSRPLVLQQIKACHYIVGIPQEYTVELTGQTSPAKRVGLWKEKRVFFLTPEVLQRDIEQGRCEMRQLVCLVLDEAHRATGDYAYCMVVRKLMAVPVQLRILALSATPGSKQETIQHVIDNLQISCIEHRSENDPEVTQYVQTREVELIEVEMGKEAEEVNDLLIDIIRPYIIRLSPFISLPKRDIHSLSPYDFLSSKDKFHQAPPPNISVNKIQEIDGILLVLITLYHIRKLLSSHGIQSASVMLEDKLKNGNFARFMNTKEEIWKAKAIMKQYMEHGIVSPKFQKLLEVLTEHFNKQDSKKSRVIIFSNFRESVSEIMASVATIGTHVKATAFIGQSSGKKSKGQTQKVQQAVLEKFRAGGYNVIVATSIGEEGLDIMEVDLVICFDANVSPLRMIQRMGRTGRKNKGRVVVLACKGQEVRGYYRKLANSKTIKKHMLNGGTSSFRFHSSPRMVPNVFRPERVMVKLLIEEYVDRGKKVKNDDVIQTPKYKLKLTNMETDLLAKYFQPLTENNWRPSLIAFPHFQAFPSRVHKVAHSIRTTMLIDTMQRLQDLSYDNHGKFFNDQDGETSQGHFEVENIEHHNSSIRGNNIAEDDFIQKEPESNILSPIKHCSPDVQSQKPSVHSFLFGSDFTSVDSLGRVIILSVPLFPFTKCSSPKKTVLPNHLMSDSTPMKIPHLEDLETEFDIDGAFTTPVKIQGNDDLPEPSKRNTTEISDDVLDITESIDSKAGELSPRLTNLLMSGVVPESPIGTLSERKGYPTTPDHDMVPGPSISLGQNKNNEGEIPTPGNNLPNIHLEKCGSGSKFVGETRTPVTKLSDSSCSKDWMLSSGEKSITQPKPNFKRLRKFGDIKSGNLSDVEEIVGHRSCNQSGRVSNKRRRGDKKVLNDARIFIDNEAEVSSEGSGDEDVDQGQDSYDGSFIDDRINPTVASTQAECDMMAIYRRSLLTQSPLIQTPHFLVDVSPDRDSIIPMDQTHDNGGSTSGPTNRTHTNNYSTSVSFTTNNLSSDAGIPTTTTGISSTTAGISKRKLSFTNGHSLPIRNLETEIEATAKEPPRKFEEAVVDDFDSDDFYKDIDFDALEEQATRELRLKSQKINEKQNVDPNLDFFDCPSFDLGI